MAENPVVKLTSQASLCGVNVFARNCAKPVKAFLGIPYAEPPQRFAPPKPIKKLWSGTRQATKLGAICPQNIKALRAMYAPFPIPDRMSEDCLNLNIWTPSLDSSAKLPVMVWIHGGAYVSGCSNYFDGTAYAALHNVVFVAISYRIGLLGYLSSGDDAIAGNMALLDQREAFSWIQKYISRFGGDPENVTLFGQSAGAFSIGWHLLSPDSHGLFRRVILQSGSLCSAGIEVLTKERCRAHFERLLKTLGIDNVESTEEAVRCLRSIPVSQIVDKARFCPVIDDCNLGDRPIRLFSSGRFAKVDVLLGFNSDEGLVITDDFLKMNPRPMSVEVAADVLNSIVRRYFPNLPSAKLIYEALWYEYFTDVTDPDILYQRSVQCYRDAMFTEATNHLAKLHAEASAGHRTFLYHFDHRPSFVRSPDWIRAAHGYEIPFVIGEPFLDRLPDIWSDDERRLSTLMMTLWCNFARTGDPNGASGDDVGFYWPPYNSVDRQHAVLCTSPRIDRNYFRHRMDVWQNVIGKLVEADWQQQGSKL